MHISVLFYEAEAIDQTVLLMILAKISIVNVSNPSLIGHSCRKFFVIQLIGGSQKTMQDRQGLVGRNLRVVNR